MKGEIFSIIDDVNNIITVCNDIRDKKIDFFDGAKQIVEFGSDGVDKIYEVIATTSGIEATIVDLFDTIFKGSVGDLVDEGKDKVDEVIGGAIGGIGGFGK